MKKGSLGLLFTGAVIVPSILLAFFAVRAVSHERAFIERQLETALETEAEAAVGALASELERVREELSAWLRLQPEPLAAPALRRWRAESPLAETAFLLSPAFDLLLPAAGAGMDAAERAFLEAHGAFLSDRAAVPVYSNVAEALAAEPLPGKLSRAADRAAGKAAVPASLPEQRREARQKQALNLEVQSALEQDPGLRDSTAREAEQKGMRVEERTVQPRSSVGAGGAAEPRPSSVFVSAPLRLSGIVAGEEEGLIPRFVDERLRLLFWKRVGGGRIAGCLLADAPLRERLAAAVPPAGSADRVLALLDEGGRPLDTAPGTVPGSSADGTPRAAPADDGGAGGGGRDWRRPLVSREVSESLPRWEVALYLADPQAVAARTRLTVLLLGVLIAILFVSVLGGGTLVLRSLSAELRLAQKKTTFVTNVSHELKTPLTSIRLYAELLQDRPRLEPDKRRRYLAIVVSETERLTRLINNVLDFSRMGQKRKLYAMAAVDAAGVCREVLESQRVRLEHEGFAVRLEAEEGPVPVKADPEALKQVLVNLLSNAEKYSPAEEDGRREIELAAGREGANACLEVRDRGIGVPPREAERIFEAFHRVDGSLTARTQGSGLGLTIARTIVRDHGGEIRCEPREGGGSVFRVLLPLEGA